MTADDLIQQSFLAFCRLGKTDQIRAFVLLAFLKDSLAISTANFAASLTRYLDFPDHMIREAALDMMDQEGVFSLPANSTQSLFPPVDAALPDSFNRVLLPAPFMEAMLNQDPTMPWEDFNLRDARSNGSLFPTTQERQTERSERCKVEEVVFETRDESYPFDKAPKKNVQSMLLQLSTSKYWYSRLLVAHVLKHHPRYVSDEIMSSLNGDSCQAVRDLAKLISGTAEGSAGNLV